VKASPRLTPSARGLRLAIVRSMFNGQVVDGLLAGAGQELLELGLAPEALTVVDVPGAFELPLAARAAAESGRFDAIVALGAVIRGETDHYEHIARAAAAGLAGVSVDSGVPVGFGLLTVADQAQALARSAPGPYNKGAEAARAAVAMVHALRRIARAAKPAKRRLRRRAKGSS
jgi:6,7-dimethyl-8-ribityllumazine synthase